MGRAVQASGVGGAAVGQGHGQGHGFERAGPRAGPRAGTGNVRMRVHSSNDGRSPAGRATKMAKPTLLPSSGQVLSPVVGAPRDTSKNRMP
jgi:hypothetical protein